MHRPEEREPVRSPANQHPDDLIEDHDRGLAFDLETLLTRRRALTLLGGAGFVAVATACGSSGSGGASSTPSTSARSTAGDSAGSGADRIPEETAGPFPGDGSNGPDVLTQSGVVRSDITPSFGSMSGVAGGVPLTINLNVVSVSDGGQALANAAVYVWHCDQEGRYSLYSQGATNENYLRGVQETDRAGTVSFASIFPGCYSGRWPHIHFEVFESLDAATSGGSKLRTSQIALPKDACESVYGSDGYEESVQNLTQVSLDTDNVFRDGYSLELGTVTGSASDGTTVTLAVPV
jgi:protocatechuate 3,4-dioxygenase beta subunit